MFSFCLFVCLFCPLLSYSCCLYPCWLCNWPLAVEFSTLMNKELNWIIIAIAKWRPGLHSHQSDEPQYIKTLDSTDLDVTWNSTVTKGAQCPYGPGRCDSADIRGHISQSGTREKILGQKSRRDLKPRMTVLERASNNLTDDRTTVICGERRSVKVLYLSVVTSYKRSINPITNPNSCLVMNTWQYFKTPVDTIPVS
jgi:hypothetical protein